MVARRGITILSDVVMMIALLLLISALWVYTSNNFKAKHTVEAASAEAAIQLYNTLKSSLSDPGSCVSMSISIPKGVRIYVANIDGGGGGGGSAAIIVKEAGRRIDAEATARLLIVLGAPRGDVKIVYDSGRAVGAAVLINGTRLQGLPLVSVGLHGSVLDMSGIDWSGLNGTVEYYNYKTSSLTICSNWSNTLQAVQLRISG